MALILIGWVKLGQPDLESYLMVESKDLDYNMHNYIFQIQTPHNLNQNLEVP